MSFHDLLNGLLTELDVPFYEGSPELPENMPEMFVTYSVYDVPKLRGEGVELVTTYSVTVNIYTTGRKKADRATSFGRDLTALFTENDFTRRSGSYGLTNSFPGYYRRIIEFYYDYDEEENEA